MNDLINKLIEQLDSIKLADIAHMEYGTELGFSEAQMIKNKTCDYLRTILEGFLKEIENIDEINLNQFLEIIKKSINDLKGNIANIEQLIKNGVNRPEYSQQRSSYIQQFRNIENGVRKNLLQAQLLIADFDRKRLYNSSEISKLKEKLEDLLDVGTKKKSELDKILTKEHDKAIVAGVKEGIETFAKLGKSYKNREIGWFVTFVIFGLLTIAALCYILFSMPPYNPNEPTIKAINELDSTKLTLVNQQLLIDNANRFNSESFLSYIIKKIMILIVPLVLFKVAMSKYNLERHLRIIYDHRAIVLLQYRDFENAIGDDSISKNQLRMEIAKYIFSDPQTGYIKDTSANEVNFNPVINLLESLKSKT